MRLLKKILHKLNLQKKADFLYEIKGKKSSLFISLPYDHKLPTYQNQFKMYDKKLITIVDLVFTKKGGVCIDIGANVGDTAVAIRASSEIPLICVEGDPEYFSYLENNTKNLSNITILKAFIGGENKVIVASLIKSHGTGKIVSGESSGSVIKFQTLNEIATNLNINASQISIIKIDTDGFDFDIIIGNLGFLTKSNASLFFEYEVNTNDSLLKSIKCIEMLSEANYKFVVYDNFGNFITSIHNDFTNRFREINAYIKSSTANGGGIYYADVFATNDLDLYSQLSKMENEISLGNNILP